MPIALLVALALTATERPSIALLPPTPTNNQADAAWAGLAIADNLNARLLIHSRFDPATLQRQYPLNVLSWRQTVSAARGEGIDLDKAPTPATLEALRRQLGCDVVFAGTYTLDDKSLSLTWQLHGAKAKTTPLTIPLADMAPAADTLMSAILGALGQGTKVMGGHSLKHMPVAAMRPFGRGLGIIGRQSLDPRAHLVLAKAELEQAHAFFSAATDVEPGFARAWVERGLVSVMLRKMQSAEEEFVQAMAHAGEFEPANSLGLYYLYSHQDKLAEAIQVLEEATSSHLGFLHGFGYLGTAYERGNANHKALEVFTQYVARVPKNPWARVMRARALARIGQHELAVQETQAVLREFPASTMVTTALASRQIDAKDLKGARETVERALLKNPDHPALLTRLSYIELEGGDTAKALALAERAVEKLGDGRGEALAGYAHLNLGHALAVLGKKPEAYAALRRAIELGVSSEDRLSLVRDRRLQAFLSDPRSPIKFTAEHVH